MLTDLQRRALSAVAGVLSAEGFALAGGAAFSAYGLTDRPSADLDIYVDKFEAVVFDRAQALAVAALQEVGLVARLGIAQDVFRQLVVSDPNSGEETIIDLGYDQRTVPPVVITGVGPVVGLVDILIGKLEAFCKRQMERDYVDVDAVLRSGRWTVRDLWDLLKYYSPETSAEEFEAALRNARAKDSTELNAYGLNAEAIDGLRERFDGYADTLHADLF